MDKDKKDLTIPQTISTSELDGTRRSRFTSGLLSEDDLLNSRMFRLGVGLTYEVVLLAAAYQTWTWENIQSADIKQLAAMGFVIVVNSLPAVPAFFPSLRPEATS